MRSGGFTQASIDGENQAVRRSPNTLTGMHPEPVEYARRKVWGVLFLSGALAFVALGAWLAFAPGLKPSARPVGLANLAFFGLCALAFARDVLRPAESLRLDSAGIHHRHPRVRAAFCVVWSRVASVRLGDEERGLSVVVTLVDPAGLPADAAPDGALAKGARPPLVPPEVTLSLASLGTSAGELAADVERFHRYYGAPPTGGGAPR